MVLISVPVSQWEQVQKVNIYTGKISGATSIAVCCMSSNCWPTSTPCRYVWSVLIPVAVSLHQRSVPGRSSIAGSSWGPRGAHPANQLCQLPLSQLDTVREGSKVGGVFEGTVEGSSCPQPAWNIVQIKVDRRLAHHWGEVVASGHRPSWTTCRHTHRKRSTRTE